MPQEYHYLIDACDTFIDAIINLSHHSVEEEAYTATILEGMKQRPKSIKVRTDKELLMYYLQNATKLRTIDPTYFMSSNTAMVLLSKLHSQVFIAIAMDKI